MSVDFLAKKKKRQKENKDESLSFGDLERAKPRSIQRLCLGVTVSGARKGFVVPEGSQVDLMQGHTDVLILPSAPTHFDRRTRESDSGFELLGYKGSWNG